MKNFPMCFAFQSKLCVFILGYKTPSLFAPVKPTQV